MIASDASAEPPDAAQCIAVHRSSSSERADTSAPTRRRYPSTSTEPCDDAIMRGVRRLRSKFFAAPRVSGTYLTRERAVGE